MSFSNREILDATLSALLEEYLRAERIERSRNFFYFNTEYFYNKYPPSKYHQEIANALQDSSIKRLAIVAPRQSAKTTLLQRFVIWSAIMKRAHFIVVIGQSFDRAKDFLKDIKAEIENNDKLYLDYGNLRGKIWAEEKILIDKDVLVMAYSKTSLRGVKWRHYRPDLVIIDDLENEQLLNSKAHSTLREWFYQTVMFLGDNDTRYIMLGTLISRKSILGSILDNPSWKKLVYRAVMKYADNQDIWAKWVRIVTNKSNPNALIEGRKFFEENKEKMLAGAEVFWEGNPSYDYYNLMLERYVSPGLVAFEAERQNNPVRYANELVSYQAIQYYDELPANLSYFLGIDPSLGLEDFTAFVVIGIDEFGVPYVVDAYQELIDNPNRIIEVIEYLDNTYNFTVIGIEAIGFQRWLKQLLIDKNPKLAVKTVDVHYQMEPVIKGQKKIKIMTMRNEIMKSRFNRSLVDLINQVISFPDTEHDDLLDALFIAYRLISDYVPLLIV